MAGNDISKYIYDDRSDFVKSERDAIADPDTGVMPNTRGNLLPIARTKEGKFTFAVPQWLRDSWNSIRLSSDVMRGYEPTTKDVTDFAVNVGLGGVSSSMIAGQVADPSTLGMFLGKRAKGADTQALARAMSMQDRGIDRDTIIEETGWFLDKDGKWKFEVPDNNLKLNLTDDEFSGIQKGVVESGIPERILPAEPTFRAVQHPELFGNYPPPPSGKAVPSHGTPPLETPYFKKEGVPQTPSYREVSAFPTTQIGVINPDEKLTSYNYAGSYTPDPFGEKIVTKGTTKEKLRWVLAHELQHAVQEREGFQSGGNQLDMADYQKKVADVIPAEGWDYFDSLDMVKQIEDSIKYAQFQIQDIESNAPGWTLIGKDVEGDIDSFTDLSDLKDNIKYLKQDLEIAKERVSQREKELGPILSELKDLKKLTSLSAFEAYQRLSGEAEARVVQKRMDYTPEQRKAIKPWQDLDVPEDELIVMDKISKTIDSLSKKTKVLQQKEAEKGYEEGMESLLDTPTSQMAQNPEERWKKVSVEEFKNLLTGKKIRPASLEDVNGTHHNRPLYRHPNTGQWFVDVGNNRGYAKGGMVKDPVSGNEVPPGAKPEEVRDNIPIRASEGEYIIPANVVRFLGLDKIEKMVAKAKEALGEMEGNGRIGGQEGIIEDDSLPFDPSELVSHADEENVQTFAEGGIVQEGGGSVLPQEQGFTGTKKFKKGDQVIFVPFQNGQPFLPIPAGYSEVAEGEPSQAPDPNKAVAPLKAAGMPIQRSGNGPSPNEGIAPSPLAGSPTEWSADNFIDYGKQKGSMDSRLIKGMISVLPGGAMALKAREKYLDSTVTQLFDTMMETGVDPRGNPITPEQRSLLSETREKLKTQMSQSSGLNLNPIERLTDAFSQFTNFLGGRPLQKPSTFQPSGQATGKPISSVSPAATQMLNPQTNSSDNQYSGGSVKVGSDLGKKDNNPTSGSMRSGGLYNKGGLVARRNKNMATGC